MFENAKPFSDAKAARAKKLDGDTLRPVEWDELTARLNAARDLRAVLHRDAASAGMNNTAALENAASRYFRGKGNSEQPVNLVALSDSKASADITDTSEGAKPHNALDREQAKKGDARED